MTEVTICFVCLITLTALCILQARIVLKAIRLLVSHHERLRQLEERVYDSAAQDSEVTS